MQDLIATARTAADLDGFLVELSKARPSNDYQAANRIDQLRQFVTRWQEYLVKVESGDTHGAQDIVKTLANESSTTPVYPRSKLLARLVQSNSPTDKIAKDLLPEQLTLDNLDIFAKGLPSRVDDDFGNFRVLINELIVARKNLQHGDPNAALSSMMNRQSYAPMPYTDVYEQLRNRITLEAVVSIIKPSEQMKPKEGETITTYLQRLLDQARDTGDWQLGYSVLNIKTNLGDRNEKTYADLSGFRFLVTAGKFETAGQYAEAVRYYLSSLRSGGPDVPAVDIGRKLKSIKEAHPKDFEAGEKLADPASAVPQDPRGRPMPPTFMGRP